MDSKSSENSKSSKSSESSKNSKGSASAKGSKNAKDPKSAKGSKNAKNSKSAKSINWSKIKEATQRLKKIKDVDELKKEFSRLSKEIQNEIQNFNLESHLSPSAQKRLKDAEARFQKLNKSIASAQKQFDRDFNRALRKLRETGQEMGSSFVLLKKKVQQQKTELKKASTKLKKKLRKKKKTEKKAKKTKSTKKKTTRKAATKKATKITKTNKKQTQ